MGTRDIKLHYNREWQAITDVDVWGYKYSMLIKDIMKNFLPSIAVVPNFRISCDMQGEFVPVFDNDSLRRCLLFGETEMDMYVDVESDNVVDPKMRTQSHLGYFVEEVEDEEEEPPEVIIVDSDSDDDIELIGDEYVQNADDMNHVEEVGGGEHDASESVLGDGLEFDEEISESVLGDGLECEDEESENVLGDGLECEDEESENVLGDGMELEDEDSESVLGDGLECELSTSTDDEGEYRNVEDHSDSITSLDEEELNLNGSDDEFSGVESDEDMLDHNLEGSDEEEEVVRMTNINAGTWFKKNSDRSIELKAGQLFTNVYHFRSVLRDFVIQEGFELKRHKNEKSRVTVSCAADGCTWRLHASPTPDGTTYKIKTYQSEHNCLRKSRFRDATSTWIANNLIHKFMADPNKSRRGIEQDLIDEFGITGLSDMKLFRARQKAKIMIQGDSKEQYAKLRSYGELVLHHNPGSTFKVTTCERQTFSTPPMFKRMFMVFDGVKKGFLTGCRPFFGLDGCFLKGAYGGMMLSAIALDGNNGILPLAVSIVESECRDSWTWFLELFKDVFGTDLDGVPWTIISDRQKGLVDAIGNIFPNAIQRFCFFHIQANFKLKFRGGELKRMFGRAACAYNTRDFKTSMDLIKDQNGEAYEWLEKIPCNLWSRHAFNTISKVEHVSNQIGESFNSWINKHRDLPILSLLEEYRLKVMKRLNCRYQRATKWSGKFVPNVVKRLNEEWQQARRFEVVSAGFGEYQCKMGTSLRVVNLNTRQCDCGKWALTGLPCMHAMACIRTNDEEVEDYCHSSFLIARYFNVYNNIIHPQPDIGNLDMPTEQVLQPPPLRRLPGRPKKVRRIHASEKVDTQRSTVIRCSNCKGFGHNKRSCQRAPIGSNKRARASMASSHGQQASASGSQGQNASQGEASQGEASQGIRVSTACSQGVGSQEVRPATTDPSTHMPTHLRPKLGIRSKAKRHCI